MRVLFVTNGHGEAAIAARIARELPNVQTHHLALVGTGFGAGSFVDVGPQRAMPSGGLVAMGNVAAFSRDLRAGFLALLGRQIGFLRGARSGYDCIVAVGDIYALLLARFAARPIVYVGTAKSVYVEPYGALERRVLRGARAIFVRDEATAEDLRANGVEAEAPGNVIVDLLHDDGASLAWTRPLRLALLPGSREPAYGDAVLLAAVARRVAELRAGVEAAMSLAPGLDAARFAQVLRSDGWVLQNESDATPFCASEPLPLRGVRGSLGALLATATIAIGQAGTANEAAAGCGLPVVALETPHASRAVGWYRMRQAKLLGDALAIVPGDVESAARAIVALLDEPARRAQMGASGRERMGGSGGAVRIAAAIARIAEHAA